MLNDSAEEEDEIWLCMLIDGASICACSDSGENGSSEGEGGRCSVTDTCSGSGSAGGRIATRAIGLPPLEVEGVGSWFTSGESRLCSLLESWSKSTTRAGGESKGETSSERSCDCDGVENGEVRVASSEPRTKGEVGGDATGVLAVGVASPRDAGVGARGVYGISIIDCKCRCSISQYTSTKE